VSALALLTDLRRRGVEIEAAGDRLRWRAPRGTVTAEVLEALRKAKPEILSILAPPPGWIERRSREWLLHLLDHDRDHATLAFARERAAEDWKTAITRTPSGVQ
jgi:hypothetical protein